VTGVISLSKTPDAKPVLDKSGYVMDLEKQVSRQLYGLPTASTCVEMDKLWISVFKDKTAS
jgi:hypothetical protein